MEKQRTLNQNASIHVYCKLVSEALNEAGLSVRETLKDDFEMDWSPTLVKEIIWKKVQKAMLMKDSTTELTTDEVTKVYETINRFLGENKGVFVPFPSQENV